MDSDKLTRIQRELGIPDLLEQLVQKLSPTDRQSLMLEFYNRCAEKVELRHIFRNYLSNRFVKPATSNPLTLSIFDQIAFENAIKFNFRPIGLSPLAPLGTCSKMATVHQNKIVSTIRNSEVLSDTTNVLALEASKRRATILKEKTKSNKKVKLCTSHRVVRAQGLADPKHFAHFNLFSLVTAGKDVGNMVFEVESLKEQLWFYLALINQLSDFQFFKVEIKVTVLKNRSLKSKIKEHIFLPLKSRFSAVEFLFDDVREAGRGYYQSICFNIEMENVDGLKISLGDGGFTDWTQKIINNNKERFLISGFGSELACIHFRKEA